MRKEKITLKQWCIENNRLDLLDSWDYEMNDFTPSDIAPQSHKQAYFKCSNCNRSLSCRIQDKLLGKTNCRYCSNKIIVSGENDFEAWCKENSKEYLLHEWDYEKNNILPSETTPYNDAKVWWKCKEGHSWPAIVRTRAKGADCPYCTNHKLFIGFNDLETWCKQNNREYLLDEWDYEKNTILPSEITAHNEKRVWWKCPLGHSYKSVLNSRTNLAVSNNRGCPECNKSNITSFPEQAILFYLKQVFPNVENGNRTALNGKELDIYIPSIKTAIEYDGDKWHINTKRDIIKNNLCKKHNITLIRIREPKCPILTDNYSYNILLQRRNDYDELAKVIVSIFTILKTDTVPDINICQDECKIRELYIKAQMENSLESYCKNNNQLVLLSEWDCEKNGDLKPENFSRGSSVRVWWKCSVCGHEWKSAINNRTRNWGCPECGKQRRAQKTKKKVLCVETGEIFNGMGEASKAKNVNLSKISQCCHGMRKTTGGYHWQFV